MVKTKAKPQRGKREERRPLPELEELPKSKTGIQGLDQVTGGGLSKGRASLICGGAGAGKILFAIEYLVKGATQFNENGVYVAFEKTPEELIQNTTSLGFHLDSLDSSHPYPYRAHRDRDNRRIRSRGALHPRVPDRLHWCKTSGPRHP